MNCCRAISLKTSEATFGVGAAAGCDLLIFGIFGTAENQKIAACGSSYKGVR
jgi:hypothetical protein